ncbi:MAG: hypothetical protein ACE5DX_00685 [Candidatus Dojkabacteria bacterium]
MKRIKVLQGAVKVGGGHIALRDFLHGQVSDLEEFNSVKFDHPGEALERADTVIHNLVPFMHEFLYFFSPRYISDFFLIATINFFREVYKVLKKEDPDIVLSTHFVLSMHFAVAKKLLKSKAVIVNCIPDYGPPSKLMNPKFKPFRSDKIMVFEEWTRQGAIKNIADSEEDVLLAGYNPKPIFKKVASQYKDKNEARKALKKTLNYFPYTYIDPNKTTVLITAGAIYARKTYPLLKELTREQKEDLSLVDKYQYFVIAGSDNKFFEKLIKKNKKFRYWSNIFPVPWIDPQVYALLQYSCDFPILGGIAPATLNELLESECGPFIIYKTRPGQELPHRAFIEEKGLGEWIPNRKKLVKRLLKGFSYDEVMKFRKRGRAFREEQAKRAEEIPGIVRNLYREFT